MKTNILNISAKQKKTKITSLSASSWIDTPKLLPSSILGIKNNIHIFTWN